MARANAAIYRISARKEDVVYTAASGAKLCAANSFIDYILERDNKMEHLLEMKKIRKDYSGVTVVKGVSLTLDEGEILALVGENGAGKSTLIKVLSGSIQATAGEIYLNSEKQVFSSPIDAIKKGVSVIYQELNYFKDLTVAENIYAGRLPMHKGKRVDWAKLYKDASEVLKEVGVEINPKEIIGKLSVAQKQLVEIAKAISKNNRIIVMDEPTAALNDRETSSLLELIKKLKKKGISFIYISHRMEEIFQVADRVMVLRDGNCVGTMGIQDITKQGVISLMVGREIKDMYPHRNVKKGDVLFEAEGITGGIVKDVSLKVSQGEIVSVFGLMGSGVTELLEEIFGVRKKEKGKLYISGKEITVKNTQDAVSHNIAYIPPERKITGLYMQQPIKENLLTPSIKNFSQGWIMERKRENAEAQAIIDSLDIKCRSMKDIVRYLSGGNQQKVLFGKWMLRKPKIILVNEPTRGVDVGTKSEIYKILEELCCEGCAVLMISGELPEVLALSDRVYIMCDGKITGELSREELSQEALLTYAIGGNK